MIPWVALTFLTGLSSVFFPPALLPLGVATLALALALYVFVSTFITPGYVGLRGAQRAMLAVPPVMISSFFFGLLDRWMGRMGFGTAMRFGVTTSAFCCVLGPFVPAEGSLMLVVGAVTSAYLRSMRSAVYASIPAAVALTLSFARPLLGHVL